MEGTAKGHADWDVNRSMDRLLEVARVFDLCAEEIEKATDNITKSCPTDGPEAVAFQSLLHIQGDMDKLARVYRNAAEWCRRLSKQLSQGASKEEILTEVFTHGQFLEDEFQEE